MDMHALDAKQGSDSYLFGPRQAWFAFAMTLGLMMVDYIDRQVIVSLFPHLKEAWGLSDKQLGALVSAVSVTVAVGGIPIALVADRFSRVKSIVAMATIWSLASISCMFTRNFGQLLAARAAVGLGEAGYGSVGAALIASHFPARMRGALMAAFFSAASIGSVLGVMLGGVIAARWGWQAAFGVVGVPGLVLSKQAQFALLAFGGFLMTCSVGVVAAVVIDVIHPGIRATGASVLSLFQNLLGLAMGPLVAGFLSDAWSLEHALIAMPVFGLLAAGAFMRASHSYGADLQRAGEATADLEPESAPKGAPHRVPA